MNRAPTFVRPAANRLPYFPAFGFALERFTLRTDRRVARGLTGFLAR